MIRRYLLTGIILTSASLAVVPAGSASSASTTPASVELGEPVEALGEVNAKRARYGLYPYQEDPELTRAAGGCARYRARRLIQGHINDVVNGVRVSDYTCLPSGTWASATGCAAWEPSLGWGSCCTLEVGYRYAGAAYAYGRDGRRYMSLFVR